MHRWDEDFADLADLAFAKFRQCLALPSFSRDFIRKGYSDVQNSFLDHLLFVEFTLRFNYMPIWKFKKPSNHISNYRINIVMFRSKSHYTISCIELPNISVALFFFRKVFSQAWKLNRSSTCFHLIVSPCLVSVTQIESSCFQGFKKNSQRFNILILSRIKIICKFSNRF